jgi:hypothetical protein
MQIVAALLAFPADPGIPISQMQGGGGKAKSAQPPLSRADEVAQLPPYQRPRALRMLALHQLIPDVQ